MLGTMTGDTNRVRFLKSVGTDQRRRDLTGQDDHWYGIEKSIGNARNGICCAGTGGHKDDAWFSGRPRIALRRMGGASFVTDEHMFDFLLLEQRVINRQNRTAGITEYGIDALFDKAVYQYLCTGFFGHFFVLFHFVEFAAKRGLRAMLRDRGFGKSGVVSC